MKKVAIVGTHGVRKTTHCYGLVANLKYRGINAEFLGEVARSSPFPINEKTTEASQRWILYTQMLRELEIERNNPDILVCDRGSVDNYAYFVSAFGRRDDLDLLIKTHSKTYDLIFRVPILSSAIEDDGVRSTDANFQLRIDRQIRELLKELEVPYRTFIGVENAVDHIMSRLK